MLASGEAVGGYYIDLRNLGNNRTLILLNGKRMTEYAASSGAASTGVSVGSIPAVVVERIEVLNGGASAIYGSDAVAGVVNLLNPERVSIGGTLARTGDLLLEVVDPVVGLRQPPGLGEADEDDVPDAEIEHRIGAGIGALAGAELGGFLRDTRDRSR